MNKYDAEMLLSSIREIARVSKETVFAGRSPAGRRDFDFEAGRYRVSASESDQKEGFMTDLGVFDPDTPSTHAFDQPPDGGLFCKRCGYVRGVPAHMPGQFIGTATIEDDFRQRKTIEELRELVAERDEDIQRNVRHITELSARLERIQKELESVEEAHSRLNRAFDIIEQALYLSQEARHL